MLMSFVSFFLLVIGFDRIRRCRDWSGVIRLCWLRFVMLWFGMLVCEWDSVLFIVELWVGRWWWFCFSVNILFWDWENCLDDKIFLVVGGGKYCWVKLFFISDCFVSSMGGFDVLWCGIRLWWKFGIGGGGIKFLFFLVFLLWVMFFLLCVFWEYSLFWILYFLLVWEFLSLL